MPYPNALIQATPRNALLGRLSDALASTYSPERTQQAQQLAEFLSVPAISRTLDRLSYGEPLTTGAGGLGGTTRFNNDALESAMAIAPMVGPTAKVFNNSALAVGRAGERLAERAVPQIMERGGLGAEMLGAMGNRTISPLDVYHGTPHTLPPTARNPLGEFDASKIGTGEGAQVYGHGIYTAENPAVAKGYQEALSNPEVVLKDGTRISKPKTGSPEDVAKAWLEEAYLNGDKTPFDTAIQKVSRLRNSANSPKQFDGALNVLNEWKKSGASVDLGGNLYKVDLPDKKIAQMLDWDKPLSQQKNILDALTPEKMGLTLRPSVDGGYMAYLADGKPIGLQMKGVTPEVFRERWINRLKEMGDLEGGAGRAVGYLGGTVSGDLPPLVAKALRQASIPGIKYFDEGSRNLANTYIVRHPQGGENVFSSRASAEAYVKKYPEDKLELIEPKVTRNFVTFPGEEKSMTILERNGQKFDNTALTGAKFVAPQDEALRLAQQRASLPPSQGGLGLPAGNTPEQRAAIMFPDEVFHGSKTPENIKKLIAGGESGSIRTGDAYGTGVYTTTDAAGDANAYGAGGAVFPLRINRAGHLQIDAPNANDLEKLSKFAGKSMLPSDKARFTVGRERREFSDVQDARDFFANQRENWNQFGGGYDRARPEALANPDGTFAVEFTNFDAPVPITSGKDADILLRATGYDNVSALGYTGHTLDRGNGRLWDVTTDTDQLRSRFAAFDPWRKTAAIAATMGVAAPDLLAGQSPQQAPKFDNSALMK